MYTGKLSSLLSFGYTNDNFSEKKRSFVSHPTTKKNPAPTTYCYNLAARAKPGKSANTRNDP